MSQYVFPILYTLFVWWFSTGVILYLDGLPRWTFKWTMLGTTAILLLSILGLYVTAQDTRVTGAYLAFTCALMVWAWQEVAFLLGYVTGPRREPCPPEARGWERFCFAVQAVKHHELALVVLGAAVCIATWNAPNQTGFWTYVVLWISRQSAKLNVFLGVRNLNESFLPVHLKYLQTYFKRKAMNPLFPVSVLVGSLVAWMLWESAFISTADGFEPTSATFVATLLSLAVLEHWFLVLPLPSEALWAWGLRSRARPAAAEKLS
jgi:putative photosynthetic complex assembly protein 2